MAGGKILRCAQNDKSAQNDRGEAQDDRGGRYRVTGEEGTE